MILDIGPQTAAKLAHSIARAGTIVWNGPLGVFEFDQFAQGTKTLALAIRKPGKAIGTPFSGHFVSCGQNCRTCKMDRNRRVIH